MSDYKVEMINDGMQEFYVQFHGPKDSEFPFLPLLSLLLLLIKLDALLLWVFSLFFAVFFLEIAV